MDFVNTFLTPFLKNCHRFVKVLHLWRNQRSWLPPSVFESPQNFGLKDIDQSMLLILGWSLNGSKSTGKQRTPRHGLKFAGHLGLQFRFQCPHRLLKVSRQGLKSAGNLWVPRAGQCVHLGPCSRLWKRSDDGSEEQTFMGMLMIGWWSPPVREICHLWERCRDRKDKQCRSPPHSPSPSGKKWGYSTVFFLGEESSKLFWKFWKGENLDSLTRATNARSSRLDPI